MEFFLIQSNELRAVWPQVKSSLLAAQAKSQEDWIPEDIYHAIKSGSAALHLAKEGGQLAGVLVTTVTFAEFSGRTFLHVWIAHNLAGPNVIEAGLDMLKDMARAAGAEMITFGSRRAGWKSRYQVVTATYGIEL